jgi:hypothetical protein
MGIFPNRDMLTRKLDAYSTDVFLGLVSPPPEEETLKV